MRHRFAFTIFFAASSAALAAAEPTAPAPRASSAGGAAGRGTSGGAGSAAKDEQTRRRAGRELAVSDAGKALHPGGEVIKVVGRAVPGSAHSVEAEALERFEHNDIHRVLSSIPGVYVREEDGFGLRPNIGMRGAGSERSAKVAVMEDGVLVAPAPYSAPAAYYFPMVTRMERIDVVKGPAAIQYGPNTVGGAVNLIGKSMPEKNDARLDLSFGQTAYGKIDAMLAARTRHLGLLVEGIKLHSDGFKKLDGGGPTGFDKHDLELRARVNSDPSATLYNQLDLKIGYADEVSSETYTGLADQDFAAAPYRRYAATQLDRMSWDHVRLQLQHRLELSADFAMTTTVYRHQLARDWTKLDGFDTDRGLGEILANPNLGNNGVFYAVLTGQADSASPSEALLLGTNSRHYLSEGIQLAGHVQQHHLGLQHHVNFGLRYHYDEVDRYQFQERYQMQRGRLVKDDRAMTIADDALGSSRALAVHVQDKAQASRITATAGARLELITTDWRDHSTGATRSSAYSVLIPGAGIFYQATPTLGFLAGVHKGFVPVAPSADETVKPEESRNYEGGLRYVANHRQLELIGFFNDYANLKGICTISGGCMSENVGDEFNGGRVHIVGAEVSGTAEFLFAQELRIPVKGSYTLTRSAFQTSFRSDNPGWGVVEVGDALPYLPVHQLFAEVGLRSPSWDVAVAGKYVGEMRDQAGQGAIEGSERIPPQLIFDFAASFHRDSWGALYLTASNLLDQARVVSRRPYGVRPGMPRLILLGYKYGF